MYLSRVCSLCSGRSTSTSFFGVSKPLFQRWNSTLPPPNVFARKRKSPYIASLLLISGATVIAYNQYQPFRHSVHAAVRCSRVAEAVILGAIDYKKTFAQSYSSDEEKEVAYSNCHTRSAERVLRSLLANGGIFIKLGQTMASLTMLPKEWTVAMRPLQDRCQPTPYEDVENLFLTDMGTPISEIFDDFDPKPIGVASLAQVHVGRHRQSGKLVAVKLQHPHLDEFCDVDMETVEVAMGWIKYWFPEFEFTWLGEEMRENLPKEMDFAHEAGNAAKTVNDFKDIRSSLYIPEVLSAGKRVLIMEYIQGGRVDDLEYLDAHGIDRNKVALELSSIFSQMVHLNGWFHADPHPGNLLIRPAPLASKSPHNFEIVLLDHGLYFDLDTDLRINYSKLMLALMSTTSPQTSAERRKYAKLVGNVESELYPVFEAALTGRAIMEDSFDENAKPQPSSFKRGTSLVDITPQSEAEMKAIREAVMHREGLLVSVFDVLRRVPRRVLMVLKLNELTRHLDLTLATTHSHVRIFLITAKCCALAVWQDDRRRLIDQMREQGLMSVGVLFEYFGCWWKFEKTYRKLVMIETVMDLQASAVKAVYWLKGLWTFGGLEGAHKAAAGLV